MLAGQKGYGANGKQNFLFPLTDLWLEQGYGIDSYSHQGTYAMDFLGYYNGIRMSEAPYYAPFDCTCVAITSGTNPRIVWTSDNEVNFIDGTTGIAPIIFIHDNDTPSFNVGDHRYQGDVIGHTGEYGTATGDHVHIEAKKGNYEGLTYLSQYGHYVLTNSSPPQDLIGVNDTPILHSTYRGVTYTWNQFAVNNPEPTPYSRKKNRFKWAIYTNRIRERRIL